MSQDVEADTEEAQALVEETEKLKALEEQCQRLKSDFTRYKERVKEDEEKTREKVKSELAKRLLSVVDTLDRAVNGYGTDTETVNPCEVVEKILDGTKNNLGMTYSQLVDALGVTPVTPTPGERFNDELHTAVETTENNFLQDKTIVSLVRKGYMLNGDLIRPAEVVISRMVEPREETEKVDSEVKPKRKGILSKLVLGFESRVFKRGYKKLEEREQELEERNHDLYTNEELFRVTIRELNIREEEFKNRVEEWTIRKEAEESGVQELEQSIDALNAEFADTKRHLSILRDDLNESEVEKEKIVIESIAVNNYIEERLAEKGELLTEIEEIKGRENTLKSELMAIEERKAASREELAQLRGELERAKETLNALLKETEEAKEKSKDEPFIDSKIPY